jgi:hypothetical protein
MKTEFSSSDVSRLSSSLASMIMLAFGSDCLANDIFS